ncbi:polysaccharide lyase family 8 super-sandwich domain-containing protein [Pontiella agarivorans]|uniref:Polysaccharide lyase family 8 super-sandwich domain-containing protein n=1 Tax=Pontiella agarivorans TaxID=3038953 RepID=A0ABU5N0S3_9BACT|nr:polysaccharide lyase family 8 super-sandwich domain-containing protein [Pontiella agarivorans]MDZ8120018.1 polysaccharide lyase family 8 super-sandwich domain-containing protein [Pontiella agarivorans]
MNRIIISWILSFWVVWTTQAKTNVIYVDFGPAGDAYSDVTDQYNNISSPSSISLKDRLGKTSGITLQYAHYAGTYNYASGTPRDAVSGISTNLTNDRLYAGTGGSANLGEFGLTLTLSGLDLEGHCTIDVIPSPTGISSTWKIVTGTGDTTEYIQDGTTKSTYFSWKNIYPDTNGTVVITGRAITNSKWKNVGISGLKVSVHAAPTRFHVASLNDQQVEIEATGMDLDYQYNLEYCTNLFSNEWQSIDGTVFAVKEHRWNQTNDAPVAFFRLNGQDKMIDIQKVHSQFIDYFAENAPNDATTQANLDSMQADGTWPDVDYESQQRSGWPTTIHLTRLTSMAQSYVDSRSSFYKDPVLLDAILLGLQHWLDEDYKNPNWFTWKISVPLYFLRTFTLLGDDLPVSMYTEGRSKIFKNTAMDMTGANQVSLATKVFMRGLLDKDISLMHQASTVLWNELYITTEEGIQPDWSYHQHGPQQQFGNYGLGMTALMIEQGLYMRDTLYAPVASRLEILRNFMLEGEAWVIWKGRMDLSGVGRNFYPNTQTLRGTKVANQLRDMIKIDPAARVAYEQVIDSTNPRPGHRSFWRSELAVHRRPEWYSSVKMTSTRVVGTETANEQNLLGAHLADGVLYLYQTGAEYEDVTGLWDWHRLPGTTCDQGNDNLLPNGWNNEYGKSPYAGVLNDGENGMAAMIYKRKNLSARKAWFFGADTVTCLGAGIGGSTSGSVYTSVEQSWLNGPVTTASGPLTTGTNTLAAGTWVQHNNIGYHLLQPATVNFGEVTGDWQDINGFYENGAITGDVFSIWIDHGASPVNASYAYTLYPQTDGTQMADAILNNETKILSQTEDLLAIENSVGVQAVFYSAGSLASQSGILVEVNQPCLLMLKNDRVIVSDPLHSAETITVTIGGVARQIVLPTDGNAGQQVSLDRSLFAE